MATILVIEDNMLNMELATDLLVMAGHDVLQAYTAEKGLTIAEEHRPDLVLLDIRLPGMDGYAAVKLLKSGAPTRAIPVVALTAEAMKGDRENALAAGFDEHLSKPLDVRTFGRTVDELLQRFGRGARTDGQ